LNPTFLIATSSYWMPTARLGIAFSQTGAEIDAICPARHVIRKAAELRNAYSYKALSPLESLRAAILSSQPDLIVTADDLTTQHLIDLHAQERANGNSGSVICELIERSIGPQESFAFMTARAHFMEVAKEEGVRIPKTALIKDRGDLEAWATESAFPIVLKADGSSSGEGTKIVQSLPQAELALKSLQEPVELIRVVKRAIVNHDLRSVRAKLQHRRATVIAQEYIPGRDATTLVACWKGQLLGALHFEVVEKQYKLGPASVMRLTENPEIEMFACKIVSRLKLSGLHGFDFLLEEQTGLPHMIELNPRATQVGHLTLGKGRDLPGALFAAVTGTPPREAPRLTDSSTIALFPQESIRDPNSSFLKTGFHDIPSNEPELIRACLHQAHKGATQHLVETYSRIFSTGRHPLL
jgi:glutathione synthase/RimK-type ligase-like ATP-grasp enzyme